MIEFRTKKDREHLLEKARKMEEYAAMIVECIEESKYEDEYEERNYRDREMSRDMEGRYGYRGRMR